MKVIEDSISSSLVPHVLQKAKGFGKPEKLSEVDAAGRPPSGCFSKRQLDHEAGQFVDGDMGERGHL